MTSGMKTREDIILPIVNGRCVLDCGGVDHDAAGSKLGEGTWLHEKVVSHAESCVGVDINIGGVGRVRDLGFERFVVADVERLPCRGNFDVVVAGEIVEHVFNMGLFLESARAALKEGGSLVITTPNGFSVSFIGWGILSGRERCHPEHTCYYSPQTLSYVVRQHGFRDVEVHLVGREARSGAIERGRSLISRMRPIFSEKVVLVARKKSG
jgi:SAM-dependent methyltransferase